MSYADPPKGRKMTPKGQMSSSGSGPAIMMMPPYIRATFMPDPPLKPLPPPKRRRRRANRNDHNSFHEINKSVNCKKENVIKYVRSNNTISAPSSKFYLISIRSYADRITGLSDYMSQFEISSNLEDNSRKQSKTLLVIRSKPRVAQHKDKIASVIAEYKKKQRASGGQYCGMNCYNTLFVGRLAYEVTERRLLRELEHFGPVKDLKLIVEHGTSNISFSNQNYKSKSKGYAFVEYEHEEDMKRAYREADGMKIEGREVVVDVERGHTVPNWLPRRLGGGLGGTRIGGKFENINISGRFDPSKSRLAQPGLFTSSDYFGAYNSVCQFADETSRVSKYFSDIAQVPPLGYAISDSRRHDRGCHTGHNVYGIDRQGYTGGRFIKRPSFGYSGNINSIGRYPLPLQNRMSKNCDRVVRRRRSNSRSPDWKEDRRRRY